jgi:cyclohexa-1,5-dienecarbonyl-CoA hydratase
MGDKLGPMMETFGKLFETYERMPMPTVAVVHGAALGGGCEVALGTDLCVAAERATFGQPEIRLGVFAPPASVLLPRLAGERRALGLLLSGESISAGEAALFGIVNKVFADESFAEEVDAWLEGLLQLSGAALRQAKRAVVATRGLPLREAHEAVDRIYLDELMQTDDANEGLQSFMEKRKPVWKHR